MGEQEGPVVVGRHGHLEAVGADLLREGLGGAGVVDQHVQPALLAVYHLGELAHRRQRREIELAHHQVLVARLLCQLVCAGNSIILVNLSKLVFYFCKRSRTVVCERPW